MMSTLSLPELRVGSSPHPFEVKGVLRRGPPERPRIDPAPPFEPRVTLAALGPLPVPHQSRGGGWLARLRLARGPATA